jgi:Exonuclease
MTGLTVGTDRIIEVAAIITDKHLKPFDEGFERVVHCPEEIMNNMDEWCTEHHGNVYSPIPAIGKMRIRLTERVWIDGSSFSVKGFCGGCRKGFVAIYPAICT